MQWITGLVALLLLFGAPFWTYAYTEQNLLADRRTTGNAQLALYEELLRGWLGKYRALPSIYAHEPDVVALLQATDNSARIAKVNAQLERWNATSGALNTYVLDAQGMAIAASNWNDSSSFLGKSYAYRPYFQQAMQGRLGRTLALGTVSGLRGYYFAYPIQNNGQIIGAVVVKAGVDGIEQELRLDVGAVFVSDRDGVVVLAGPPHWRMKTLRPLLDDTRDRIARERRFPVAMLQSLPVTGLAAEGNEVLVRAQPDRSERVEAEFLHLSTPMTPEGWRVHLLSETRGIRYQSLKAALLAGFVILTALLLALLLLQRRRRMIGMLAARQANQRDLERLVTERTANLREVNENLELEVRERSLAQADLQRTQSELIQAGKLAALGQMSAALSHEFNQPLAAIRTYSDNAVAFLDRGRSFEASENLARISRLTERMARLSKHLTSFARKPKDTVEPVSLDAVIAETLALLQARIVGANARIDSRLPGGMMVMGGQTRLQHVLMNLIGNALDATAGGSAPIIVLRAENRDDALRVIVEDNGPGVPEDVLANIFDPFFSTKEPGKGLGLGLSISYNIMRDFNGNLHGENREEGGARFIVTLHHALATQEAAE